MPGLLLNPTKHASVIVRNHRLPRGEVGYGKGLRRMCAVAERLILT